MRKKISLIILSIIIIACRSNQEYKPEVIAEQACECFEKQSKGTIDERLDPCFAKPINKNFSQIHKQYYTSEPTEVAIQNYMLDATIMLIRNCNTFSDELDYMYTNFYPEISPQEVQKELINLQDSININSLTDSTKIRILNRRITLFTRSRKFDDAIREIEILENKFNQKSETYFARAYIFRARGNYDAAISEIEKAMASGNNRDYTIFKELLKKKKEGNNT